jgi:hypothetical protein
MMHNQLGNNLDVEQLIKDARYARMKFVRKNFRFFVFGSGLLGVICAFAITLLSVGSVNRQQETNRQFESAQHATAKMERRTLQERLHN